MKKLEAFIGEEEPNIYIVWHDKTEAEAFLKTELGRDISLRFQSIRELNKMVWSEDKELESSTLDILKSLVGVELKKPVFVINAI